MSIFAEHSRKSKFYIQKAIAARHMPVFPGKSAGGGYRLSCIETPGHTKGHLCLYEPEKKLLFAGDLILSGITPNISLWSHRENPLKDYLASLEKVSQLDISLALPGHRSTISNCRQRIEELKSHYRKRASEVLEIVGKEELDAYQVATRMTWNFKISFMGACPGCSKVVCPWGSHCQFKIP